jgi:hypothetical protein
MQTPHIITPGPDPTIVSYSGSAVKIYYAGSSLVRFENKKYLILKNVLAYYNAGVVVVNSQVVGLFPARDSNPQSYCLEPETMTTVPRQ